jgi:hypothetical protein
VELQNCFAYVNLTLVCTGLSYARWSIYRDFEQQQPVIGCYPSNGNMASSMGQQMLECSIDLENLSMNFRVLFLASFATLALLTGCNAGVETSTPAPTTEAARVTTPAPTAASNPGAAVPGGNDKPAPVAQAPRGAPGPPATPDADAPLAPTPEEDKAIKDAEASKDNAKAVAAYVARASRRVNDDKAGPKIRFTAVVKDAKRALTLDPGNKRAASLLKLAEGRLSVGK